MPLPFFYEENLVTGKSVLLSEDTARHAIQVLRMQAGELLVLTDGKGKICNAAIETGTKKATTVNILTESFVPAPKPAVTVAVSLLKNNTRFEWLLEKATEIGITKIVPLLCERTERQHFRHNRFKSIILSAMLQSQQAWLMHLSEPILFRDFVAKTAGEQKFIAHCTDGEKRGLDVFSGEQMNERTILIGPEGDFTENEIGHALTNGFIPVSLGNTRLRSETAAIVASVWLTRG